MRVFVHTAERERIGATAAEQRIELAIKGDFAVGGDLEGEGGAAGGGLEGKGRLCGESVTAGQEEVRCRGSANPAPVTAAS